MYTNNTMQKIRKNLKEINTLIKSFYPVGTTRDWKDGKYKKVADDKWVKVEEKNNKQLEKTSSTTFIGHAKRLRIELKENLISQIGLHKNKKTGIEAQLSGTSIGKICSTKAINKSKNNGFTIIEHFEMANQIIDLFENAPNIILQNDNKNNDKNVKIERFVSKKMELKSGKKAKAYITVKHTVNTDGRLLYSIEAMDIKKEKALEKTRAMSGQQLENFTSPSACNTISQTDEKSIQKSCWCYFTINKKTGETHFYIKKSAYDAYYNSKKYN